MSERGAGGAGLGYGQWAALHLLSRVPCVSVKPWAPSSTIQASAHLSADGEQRSVLRPLLVSDLKVAPRVQRSGCFPGRGFLQPQPSHAPSPRAPTSIAHRCLLFSQRTHWVHTIMVGGLGAEVEPQGEQAQSQLQYEGVTVLHSGPCLLKKLIRGKW